MKRLLTALAFLGLLTPAQAQEAQGFQPCAAFTFSVTNSTANTQLSSCAGVLQLINGTSTEVFYTISASSSVTATASGSSTGASTSFSLPANSQVFVVIPALPGLPAPFIAMIAGVAGPTLIRINQGWRNG